MSCVLVKSLKRPRIRGGIARAALMEENLNVAGALAWSALQAGPDASMEILRTLKQGDDARRLRAVRILVQAERNEETDWFLCSALEDTSAAVRRVAALEVGEIGGVKAFHELIAMIIEGDHDTEAADVLAESEHWHDKVLETIEFLVIDPDEDSEATVDTPARARLVQALAEFEGSDELLEKLVSDPTPVVALTAKAILSTRG